MNWQINTDNVYDPCIPDFSFATSASFLFASSDFNPFIMETQDKIIIITNGNAAAIDAVGGRYVMIECHEEQKLMDF